MTSVCFCAVLRATQIKTYSWDNAQVILVGNKCDLEDDRLIPTEDTQRLADELGKIHTPDSTRRKDHYFF